jgi:hypothetical protein
VSALNVHPSKTLLELSDYYETVSLAFVSGKNKLSTQKVISR